MPRTSPDQIIDSAVALARAILASGALEAHKREFLSFCIWKASEADGKYNVRYWSEGVVELVQKHGSLATVLKLRPMPLRHEHVNTRERLVDMMIKDPSCVEKVLREDAITCLVTPAEHSRLSDKQSGFERYKMATIRVWDVVDQEWLSGR